MRAQNLGIIPRVFSHRGVIMPVFQDNNSGNIQSEFSDIYNSVFYSVSVSCKYSIYVYLFCTTVM